MRVAIVSDTHIPAAGQTVPDWVGEFLEAADHVVHAGDFITAEARFRLRVLADGDVTEVRGNRDPRLPLPEVATATVGGVGFVVTHGDQFGRGESYRRGLADLAAEHDADVAVGGHTHQVLVTRVDGVHVCNPGSATGAPPADGPTLLTVDCVEGDPAVTRHDGPP